MNIKVKKLVESQNRLVNEITSQVDELLKSTKKEDTELAGMLLVRAFHGLPKHKRLRKLLQDANNMKLMKETELFFMRDKGVRMHEIDDELYYTVDEKNHQIDITEKGRNLLGTGQEDPEMFVIPDIATELSAIEGNEEMSPEEKSMKTIEWNRLYAERSDRIHTINQLLRAYSLYEKDVEYVVQDAKVMIVDEFTGRILEGRRYSEGLHQAIEAKERVKVQRDTQTMATVTLQNYFRLYKKLAGMTGTADTEAGEFEKIYSLDVVVVPTNRPIVRQDYEDLIYRTKREKYNALVDQVAEEIKNGRAVLVGTASVEVSELLSKMLKRKNMIHNVLNAKQHQKEADIIANAGKKGAVTIATNMAGRGTDIKLDHEVRKNGGLAIVGSERHDARRIDRQLRGRAGRQGDPGSSQFFISLEDDLMRLFGGEKIAGVMQRLKVPEGEPIQHSMISKSVERAQKKVEENNFGIRKRLLEYDNVMNMQREVIYARRRAALRGERLKGELFEYIENIADEWYDMFHEEKQFAELKNAVLTNFLCDIKITADEFEKMTKEDVTNHILEIAAEFYKRKEEALGPDFMSKLEQYVVLQTIDEKWRDHLREMDDLKEGIHLRSYGQKDPLLEYKHEAYGIFKTLIKEINKQAVTLAFRYFPQVIDKRTRTSQSTERKADDASLPQFKRSNVTATQNLSFEHSSSVPAFISGAGPQQAQAGQTQQRTVRNIEKKVGRNEPCPCGSGKKFKSCCGKQ